MHGRSFASPLGPLWSRTLYNGRSLDPQVPAAALPGPSLIPEVIDIFNHSRSFLGVLHLREYVDRPRGSLPACVEQTGAPMGVRMKPSDAEDRAGQGGCKSWKTTFRSVLNGKAVTIQVWGGGGGGVALTLGSTAWPRRGW